MSEENRLCEPSSDIHQARAIGKAAVGPADRLLYVAWSEVYEVWRENNASLDVNEMVVRGRLKLANSSTDADEAGQGTKGRSRVQDALRVAADEIRRVVVGLTLRDVSDRYWPYLQTLSLR